jgi:hypothetical protein
VIEIFGFILTKSIFINKKIIDSMLGKYSKLIFKVTITFLSLFFA